jgi:hypothetical protein
MFEMMNQQALSVGAGRRHELAVATMREARLSNGGGARQTVGLALVSLGQRFAGKMPPQHVSRPEGDCA